MHSFHYRDGRLFCEAVDLSLAAEKFRTPLYLYSASTVLDHYRRLDKALSDLDHLICYAVKANSNRAILGLLAKEGSGFDIVSGGELFRALEAGADPGKCSFAGVGKSREEIEYALAQGVYSFNVESEAELDQINQVALDQRKRAPVAFRINPDIVAPTHEYISTGSGENKFGIPLGRGLAAYRRAAAMKGIRVRGVQMHIGSQITETRPFVAAIEKLSGLVAEIRKEQELEFFSVGGGWGIAYESSIASAKADWWTSQPTHPLTISDYATAIVPHLTRLGLRILLEPGRLLVGNAGVLLTRVMYLKESAQKRFAIVDAGMNDLIRPALYGSYHEIVPVVERGGSGQATDIVGPVCESGDFFAQDRPMPVLEKGDVLAIMSTGAYGSAMASNYNSRPLPAEAMVQNDQIALIRRRQTWEDLLREEVAELTWTKLAPQS